MTPDHRPISSLTLNPRNPRTHSEDQVAKIAASITEFGFVNPVLVDENGAVLAGHGRIMAAKRLGMVHVPVVEISNFTEAQKQAYLLADNRLALDAGWAPDLLAGILNDLKSDGFDLHLTGFSTDELDKLLAGEDPYQGEGERDGEGHVDYSVVVSCDSEADQQALIQLLSKHRYSFRVVNE
jgi:ParB-like chromosome segregation protein Spo0J